MSSSLETKFTGDSKQLEAAYEKIARENVKLREQVKQTADEHKHAGEETEGMLDRIGESIEEQVGELAKMAVAWASVEKAVELVNEEYERQIELAEKAAEATREAGSHRGAVIRNLGPIGGEERKEFFERLEEVGLRRGLKEDQADQAINYMLSATGGNRERSIELLDLAARAVPEGGGDTVGQVGRGIEQVRTASHDEDQEANLGRLFSLQKIAPIKDIENIAAYAVPAIQNMSAMGDTFEQSAGLFAALAKTSGDVEGRRTRTAVTSLQGALHDFFDPEKQAAHVRQQVAHLGSLEIGEKPDEALAGRLAEFLKGRGVTMDVTHPERFKETLQLMKERPELGQAFVEQETSRMPRPTTVAEQVHTLQRDEALRQQFMRGFTPEAQARGADIELLRGGSDTAKMFDQATAELQGTNYKQAAQRQLETIASEPTIQRMQQQRIGEVGEEQMRAGDFQRADVGTALKAIEQMLDQTNQGMLSGMENWWAQKAASYRLTQLGEDPRKLVEEIAHEQIFALRYQVPEGMKPNRETIEGAFSGKISDRELAAMGMPRTTDEERLRKARIAEETNERFQSIGRREAGHEEEATEEATPREEAARQMGSAQPSQGRGLHLPSQKDIEETNRATMPHGFGGGDFFSGSPEEAAEHEADIEANAKTLRRMQQDLQQPGATEKDLQDAQQSGYMANLLEQLLQEMRGQRQDAAKRHTENQTTMRSYGARAGGRAAIGREVA